MKSPGVAAVLSFLIQGLGQIYNGQILKGLILVVLQAINVALMNVLIGFITYPILLVYAVYDAYRVAERTNRINARRPPA